MNKVRDMPHGLAPNYAAPQHMPRPLALLMDMMARRAGANPALIDRALRGLRLYQACERPFMSRPPVLHRVDRLALYDYPATGKPKGSVLVVPSLINSPFVLDLAPDRSFMRYLAANGWHAVLVDWGMPGPDDAGQDINAMISDLLVPAIGWVRDHLPSPLHMVGYCLGGTIAAAASTIAPPDSLSLIATPWNFDGYAADARAAIAKAWQQQAPHCAALGMMPLEMLQTIFWNIEPDQTIAKFARIADEQPNSAALCDFARVEDWASSGAPIPYAVARMMMDDFITHNTPGTGHWMLDGQVVQIDPSISSHQFLSLTDRIAPAATRVPGMATTELRLGHVGMMVGSQAQSGLWQPLCAFLDQVETGSGPR